MGIFNIFSPKTIKTELKNNGVLLQQKDERKAECPYCHKTLLKIPGAKTKCPFCSQFMFVRTDTKGVRSVVTIDQANQIDKEWVIFRGEEFDESKIKASDLVWPEGEKTVVNRFLAWGSGISEKEIYDRRLKSFSINDALWSLCNQHILSCVSSNDSDRKIRLLYCMEYILVSENKNANHLVKRRLYEQLLQQKRSGAIIVIVGCILDESCEACRRLEGKEFSIDEAIKKQPLPPPDCKCLCCSCTY